ncbi:MAG: hypothetical protein B7Z55_07880, partial [Planctomycetales bacterium 12-60-4]
MLSQSHGRPHHNHHASTGARSLQRLLVPTVVHSQRRQHQRPSTKFDRARWRLFDQFPVASLLVDADGQIRCANKTAMSLLKLANGSVAGAAIESLIPGLGSALRDQFHRLSPDLFQTVGDFSGKPEITWRSRDDACLRVLAAQWVAPSQAQRILCVLRPVTKDQHTDRDLQRFFDLSLDCFCIANLEGHFIKTNANFSLQLGYADDELTRQPFLSFVHPDDQASTIAEMSRLIAGETVSAFCNRYRDVHGDYHWFEWTARSIPGEDLVFAVARDVTDRILVEQQLRAMERRERALLDNTPAVIYIKDTKGRYQFINREFSRLFRVTLEEAHTKTDFDIFPEELAVAFRSNDRFVLEQGKSIQVEEVALHDDGPHTYLSMKCPIPSPDGESIDVAGISTDITDRLRLKRTADELRLAQEVQRRLFPQGEIHVPGFEVFGRVVPASQLCGDYFDYVVRPNGHVAFCVADVSGHGFPAALLMATMHTFLDSLSWQCATLEELLYRLSRFAGHKCQDGKFVTLIMLEIDLEERTIQASNAGHVPCGYVLNEAGEVARTIEPGSCPLGLIAPARPRFATCGIWWRPRPVRARCSTACLKSWPWNARPWAGGCSTCWA